MCAPWARAACRSSPAPGAPPDGGAPLDRAAPQCGRSHGWQRKWGLVAAARPFAQCLLLQALLLRALLSWYIVAPGPNHRCCLPLHVNFFPFFAQLFVNLHAEIVLGGECVGTRISTSNDMCQYEGGGDYGLDCVRVRPLAVSSFVETYRQHQHCVYKGCIGVLG